VEELTAVYYTTVPTAYEKDAVIRDRAQ